MFMVHDKVYSYFYPNAEVVKLDLSEGLLTGGPA